MATKLPSSIQNTIDALSRLPGIGPKMASRLVFHLLRKGEYELVRLVDSLDSLRTGLRDCSRCGHIAEGELCAVCLDATRNSYQIAVVEEPLDVMALERTGSYGGTYHVLGGALSPIDGIGPEQLRIRQLLVRATEITQANPEKQLEIILATNPSLEGEATATYIQQQLITVSTTAIAISRIARGLPMGSDLEYADPATLLRALEGRRTLQ